MRPNVQKEKRKSEAKRQGVGLRNTCHLSRSAASGNNLIYRYMEYIEIEAPIEEQEKEVWEPDVDKLPPVVKRELDKELDRLEKENRLRAQIKALLFMVKEAKWKVGWTVYDDRTDTRRKIYKIA